MLVAVAVFTVLLGLVLTAIQKVRTRAVRAGSENNLRQIGLGLHGYAAAKKGRLPGATDPNDGSSDRPVLINLVPYIDGQTPSPLHIPRTPTGEVDRAKLWPRRAVFLSPLDPSLPKFDEVYLYTDPVSGDQTPAKPDLTPPTSYAENLTAFTGPPTLPASFPDGTSNTIAFGERYTLSYRFEVWSKTGVRDTRECKFSYSQGGPSDPVYPPKPKHRTLTGWRRATFADAGWGDVVPVTENGITRASVPGRTFQDRPPVEQADAAVLQSPHAGGLPVAMFDGSVRVIAPAVAEAVFWAAVTPAGGETARLD
jgi:prepilin-type processing-associated H-X9-DG protein